MIALALVSAHFGQRVAALDGAEVGYRVWEGRGKERQAAPRTFGQEPRPSKLIRGDLSEEQRPRRRPMQRDSSCEPVHWDAWPIGT